MKAASPPETADTLVTMLSGVVAALLFTWPLPLHPTHLLGHPFGETDNHLWMLWQGVQGLSGRHGPWADFPVGIDIPLMDPVNLPLALGMAIDPALGYDLVLLCNVVLGLWGGYFLGRHFGGPGAARVAMVALGCSPFLSGVAEFGITEAWPLWALAFHLGFLFRFSRDARWLHALGAGLSLGAFALSGWYHALFALILEGVVLPFLWNRRAWKGLVLQGILAAILVLPQFNEFLAVRDLWSDRFIWPKEAPPFPRLDWREIPVYGTDLLNLLLPALHAVPISRSTYLGLAVSMLALRGVWRHPREAAPLALAVTLLCALALGHWVRIAGHTLHLGDQVLVGPARILVRHLPPLVAVTHWYRAVGPATVPLAALAALGARGISHRPISRLLPMLILLDSLVFGQTRWPRWHYDSRPPAIYAQIHEAGPIIELPFDNGREAFSQTPARIYNRWQPFHGNPVAENYEGVDHLLESSPLVAWIDGLCGLTLTLPFHQRAQITPWETGMENLHEDRCRLQAMGIRWILLHRDRARTPQTAEDALRLAFGAPAHDTGSSAAWRVTCDLDQEGSR